ncbi:MAG: choice-of-anchor Q domain-containing protein [Rudaea sp.]
MKMRTLALAGLLAALPLADALATTWTVTGTGDTPAGCAGTNCPTLRDAINAAQNRDVIQFSSTIDGATILLSQYSNTQTGTEFGPSAFFITSNKALILDGETGLTRGITIERDSTQAPFRLFDIDVGSGLTLQGLTLKNGLAQGFSSDFGGGALGAGGAIFNQGTVSIDSCTFVGNVAQGGIGGNVNGNFSGGAGVGSTPSGGNGGGPNGSISNTADGGFGGGGFASSPGTNGGFGGGGGGGGAGGTGGAGGFGGGGGNGSPAGSGGFGGGSGSASYGGGGAGMGGAIFNDAVSIPASLTIVNSTFTANSASGGAGGSGAAGGSGFGGAIFNYSAVLNIQSSTLARNGVAAASGGTVDGGAVYSLDDRNCSAGGNTCGNSASTFDLENSIFSNSQGGTHDIVINTITPPAAGTFSGLIVMSYDNTQFTISNPVSSADPMLSPLGHYGGPTPTMVPHQRSAAIDSVTCALAVDQRGVARPQGTNCDVGAVEYDGDYIFANGFDY